MSPIRGGGSTTGWLIALLPGPVARPGHCLENQLKPWLGRGQGPGHPPSWRPWLTGIL